jgi:hypothetical protein
MNAPDNEFRRGDSAFESIGGWEVEVGSENGGTRNNESNNNKMHKLPIAKK